MPVTPSVVSWARENAGFTLEEAKTHFPKIESWESSGDVSPTYPQLEGMANKFKVPIAVFFFPEPPKVPSIDESFRTLPDQEMGKVPNRIKQMLRKAKAFQLSLSELHAGSNPSPQLLTREIKWGGRTKVKQMATRVRDSLGVSVTEQQSWEGTDHALMKWRDALLNVGINVFKDSFKEDNFSGFCLYDDEFPVIYVNNSVAKSRQIFTLFHELGHLIFETSGMDWLDGGPMDSMSDKSRAIEISCNQFAAELLVPSKDFDQVREGMEASRQMAASLAARFHVSRELIYRKCLDLGLVTRAEYQSAAHQWSRERKSKEGSGGNHYYTMLTYLGWSYVEQVLSQYHRSKISLQQAADHLGIKPGNLDKLETYYIRGNQ